MDNNFYICVTMKPEVGKVYKFKDDIRLFEWCTGERFTVTKITSRTVHIKPLFESNLPKWIGIREFREYTEVLGRWTGSKLIFNFVI